MHLFRDALGLEKNRFVSIDCSANVVTGGKLKRHALTVETTEGLIHTKRTIFKRASRMRQVKSMSRSTEIKFQNNSCDMVQGF